MKNICISGKARDVTFALRFLKLWFGGEKIADVPQEEIDKVMRFIFAKRKSVPHSDGN